MRRFTFGYRLPYPIARRLYGDRRRHGLQVKPDDPCWRQWIEEWYVPFYRATQRGGIGARVNDAGYRVMRRVDLEGRRVLEIGPGELPHLRYWRGRPARVTVADVLDSMLQTTSELLDGVGVPHECVHVSKGATRLPFPDAEFDILLTFYSLEHLYPLEPYVQDMVRVLRPGGSVIGAIPAEGGIAWGLGRFMSSRRWLRANTSIDPDKIICWEHPNFADTVLEALDRNMSCVELRYWPLRVPSIDLNLVVSFRYDKR